MADLDATVAGASANSYATVDEFDDYMESRPFPPSWYTAADELIKEAALMAATRALDQILTRFRRLEIQMGSGKMIRFYVVRPYWTGSPTTTTQALAWPRVGMMDRNGNLIDPMVIPDDLKIAQFEMALFAGASDLSAENSVVAQGITSIKAGPVELTFKDFIQKRILPDSVYLALVPSWITDEIYENVPAAQFQTIGLRN